MQPEEFMGSPHNGVSPRRCEKPLLGIYAANGDGVDGQRPAIRFTTIREDKRHRSTSLELLNYCQICARIYGSGLSIASSTSPHPDPQLRPPPIR